MKAFLLIAVAATLLGASPGATAQDRPIPLADVLELDATVASEVAPDLAVVTLAIVREGAEVAALTREVNEALARAFADAKAVPAVIAANGGYGTTPRYDTRGNVQRPQRLAGARRDRPEVEGLRRDRRPRRQVVADPADRRLDVRSLARAPGAGGRVAARARCPSVPGQGHGGDAGVRLRRLVDPPGDDRQRVAGWRPTDGRAHVLGGVGVQGRGAAAGGIRSRHAEP